MLNNTKSLIVRSMYRTPSHRGQDQMSIILDCRKDLDNDNIIWIEGDFNLPNIDWPNE